MKKILVVGAIFLTLMGYKVYAALDGGAITTTVKSNTSVLIQITTLPTGGVDSVYVCRMTYGGSDTSFVATIDSVTTNKMINSQSPNAHSIFFLKVCGNAGYTISDKDTVTLYPPEIGETVNTATNSYIEKVIRAVSWRAFKVTPDTLYASSSSAKDSSAVYEVWDRNSFTFRASQANDSCKAMVYFYYGYRQPLSAGTWYGFADTPGDSLNITGAGTFGITLPEGITAPSMYYTIQSYTGNGYNAKYEGWLKRDRY